MMGGGGAGDGSAELDRARWMVEHTTDAQRSQGWWGIEVGVVAAAAARPTSSSSSSTASLVAG